MNRQKSEAWDADDYREHRADEKARLNNKQENVGIQLQQFAADNGLEYYIMHPWQLRLSNGTKAIDIYPRSNKYNIVMENGVSIPAVAQYAKYHNLFGFLRSAFGITEKLIDTTGFITFESFCLTHRVSDLVYGHDLADTALKIGPVNFQRYVLVNSPDMDGQYIMDLSKGYESMARVWFYKNAEEMISYIEKIHQRGGAQVPGFMIVIVPLSYGYGRPIFDMTMEEWDDLVKQDAIDMAKWYAARVAIDKVDGSHKRYKL